MFNRAATKSEWTPKIESAIWTKFIFICAYGEVAAASGKALAEILDDPQLAGEVAAVMTDVVALAGGERRGHHPEK